MVAAHEIGWAGYSLSRADLGALRASVHVLAQNNTLSPDVQVTFIRSGRSAA
jgi:hypothetical protein